MPVVGSGELHSGAGPAGRAAGPRTRERMTDPRAAPSVTAAGHDGVPSGPWHGHMPALDGLRGLAVLLVMLLHFQLDEPDTALGRVYLSVVESGWAGVDLFFVLSGFLITGILYDSREREGYFRSFYARRALRIFPLYFGFLALRFFVAPELLRLEWAELDNPPAQQAWAWLYLTNLQIVLFGPGSEAPFTGHFWSLAIEEQFYLAWPAVVLLLPRRRLMAACALMVAAAPLLRAVFVYGFGASFWAYYFTPSRMDALAMGALVALALRTPGGLERMLRWRLPVLAATGAALAALYLWRGLGSKDAVVLTAGMSVVGVFFAALIVTTVAAAPHTPVHRAFVHPVLLFFGRYSYSLYVFHLAVDEVLQRTVFRGLGPVRAGPVLVPAQLLFLLAGVSITIALSVASWHLYEKHFLRLKDRFVPGRPRERGAAPARLPAGAPGLVAGD